MPKRTKFLILAILLAAGSALAWAVRYQNLSWVRFGVFLAVILASSGLKVVLPQGEGSMSLNFPFILLAVVELSPLQAMLLAALSVAAQCRLRVRKLFTAVQIVFNIGNSISATAMACVTYLLLTRHGMASAPALALASVSYFLASTTPVAIAIATSTEQNAFELWKTEFPWYLPFYFVGAILAALADGIGSRFGSSTSLLLIPMVYTIYRAYTAQIVRAKEKQQHLEETEALHHRTIEGLAMAIEAKDQETHEHLFRVRSYVTEIGKALALSKLDMSALHTAAFLHDIGKLAVPEHIINKPGKLTLEEFEKMKIHPVVGADILDRVRFPYPVVPIVRSHHEWWNGQGYPDGLRGEDIPIGARILTVVDCFDALTSDRPYRKGKTLEEAMAIVRSLSGTQFDPMIVDVFQSQCLTLEQQTRHGADRHFVPLNRDVDVWRGAAPGAGFEQQNAEPEQASSLLPDDRTVATEQARSNASLLLIAAASQEAQALFEMSQSVGTSLSLQEAMSVMTSRLHRLVRFDCCALYFKQGETVVLSHIDGDHASSFSAEPVMLGEGISGWVAQNGKAILNGNALVEPSYHFRSDQDVTLRSALSMPLLDLEQNVFAVLTLYAFIADSFSKDHLRILQVMESKLSLSLLRLRRFEQVQNEAGIDLLTNLPNAKRLFLDIDAELNRCRRTERSIAIVMCDLDSFKDVNDLEGQIAGDTLLRAVAESFREGCRSYDTVARTGGDEFVFVLPDTSAEDLAGRLSSILDGVSLAGKKAGVKTEVTASLGASFFPEDGDSVEDLLALADRRMYAQKATHHRSRAAFKEQPTLATSR